MSSDISASLEKLVLLFERGVFQTVGNAEHPDQSDLLLVESIRLLDRYVTSDFL